MLAETETIELTPTQALLQQWAEWMRSSAGELGYPDHAAVCVGGGIAHWDDLEESNDNWRIQACDAVLDDLRRTDPILHMALSHRYLDTVYRFPRDNYPELLIHAHLKVRKGLLQRDVVV